VGGVNIINFDKEFMNLKKSFKGKGNFLFLVNDRNNEIKQHYDPNFNFSFDLDRFKKSQLSKEQYCNKRNINYHLFVIPDRSIVLKDYLPFEVGQPYRIVDNLVDVATDLLPIFDDVDYIPTDTHMTHLSAGKCVAYMLSKMHPEKTMSEYSNELWDHLNTVFRPHSGDLVFGPNWSYGDNDDYLSRFKKINLVKIENTDDIKSLDDKLPFEFRKVGKRETLYYRNENSISDKKLLLCSASSMNYVKKHFIAYYREVICYWDHWYFNQDLVDWFKPDDINELRVERFLEDPLYPIIEEGGHVQVPITMDIIKLSSDNGFLYVTIDIKDYHMMPVITQCDVSIDDEYVDTLSFNGEIRQVFEVDFNNKDNGYHKLDLNIKPTSRTKGIISTKNLFKKDSKVLIPAHINIKDVRYINNKLHVNVDIVDFYMNSIEAKCDILIDNNKVYDLDLNKMIHHEFELDVDLDKGEHSLSIHLPETSVIKHTIKDKAFIV